MGRAFVVRLVAEPLEAGQVVGRVEAVDTGEETVVRSADELIAVLTRPSEAREGDGADEGPGDGPGGLGGTP